MSTTVFTVTAGINSNGPFSGPPFSITDSAFCDSISPSGHSAGSISPNPSVVNGAQVVVFGDIGVSGGGGDWIVLCLTGSALAQSFIDSVVFNDGSGHNYNLLQGTAHFNDAAWGMDNRSTGFTTWAWPCVATFPALTNPVTVNWTGAVLTYAAPTALSDNLNNGLAVGIAWVDSAPTSGIGPPPTQYLVYRGGVFIGTSNTVAYVDNTVVIGTTYLYTVAAGDGHGVAISAQSSALSVTTPDIGINVYGAFAPAVNFKPALLVNAKGIQPRVYMPLGNTTVRSKQ